MSLNTRLKSALLAVTMVTTVPATTTVRAGEAAPVTNTILTLVSQHKAVISVFALVWGVFEVRLRTRPKADFKMEDLRADFKEVLDSSIFDSKLYKQLLFMFDKYVIGLPLKLENLTTRRKEADDSVTTLSSKKLVQKPFGFYGLFDAYALMHMKKFTDYVPVIAGTYVLLNNPLAIFGAALTKANPQETTVVAKEIKATATT